MQLANKPTTFLSRLTGFCSNLSALILMGMLSLASAPAAAQFMGCQQMSDTLGVIAGVSFGSANALQQQQWIANNCNTKPKAAAPSPTPAAGVVCNPGSATRATAYGGYIGTYNKQTPRGTTCVACAPGHASADGKDCLPCAYGMIGNKLNGGATQCAYPGPGRVTERADRSRVYTMNTVACIQGTFNPGNRLVTDYRSCERCPVNTFSQPGAGQCTPCPPGKSTKGSTGNGFCS